MRIKIGSKPAFEKVAKKFERVPRQITKDAGSAIKEAALIIEGWGKFYTPVDTGRLRASIYTTLRSMSAIVQPKTNYALFVHEGTSRMKARPFMKQAVVKILREDRFCLVL